MSTKRKTYSNEFKTKVVLEVLENNATINEIASKYNILPKSIQQWKKQFLENAPLVFEEAVPVKKYKEQVREKEKQIEDLQKALGKATIERDWILKKVKSLGSSDLRGLVDPKLKIMSITRQTELLGINRPTLYYKKRQVRLDEEKALIARIQELYSECPFYGFRKMVVVLKEEHFKVGKKKVKALMNKLNIKAIYPKKKFTTISNKQHKKYKYLLKEKDFINRPDSVWASDITYVKLEKGFAYFCAVIDWYTRAILSYRLSNSIDTKLVVDTLNDAIAFYGKPDIFNTDQGSQYTSDEFISILTKEDVKISMDSKGRAYDNIIIERFWRTLKYENVYLIGYSTIKEARDGIGEYINFYNYKRPHASLGYKTPMSVYKTGIQEAA
jgi:putative transposase